MSSGGGLIVQKILDLIGMSAGGWVGWTIGAWIIEGIFTAFIVSMIGTGIGLYVTRRFTKQLLP